MNIGRFLRAACEFERLIEDGGLPAPDRITYWVADEKLEIAWYPQDYAPVFDLEEYGDRHLERTEAAP